jgi:hypothetical protein
MAWLYILQPLWSAVVVLTVLKVLAATSTSTVHLLCHVVVGG